MVSCYKIFDYWEDKCINEKGEVSGTSGILVVSDPYTPRCFACGKPVYRDDELVGDELKDLWSDKKVNSKLQKCHILAKQFGGSDEPENLFLMCADCHAESPDTRNRAAFFRWVYRRKREYTWGVNLGGFLLTLEREIEDRGYIFEDFLCGMKSQDMSEIIKLGIGRAGLHGTHIAHSSVVIGIVDEMEQRFLDMRKRELLQGA